PSTPDPAPPPVDATLTRVDYDLRVSGETVSGQGRRGGDGHKKGRGSGQVLVAIGVRKRGWAGVQGRAGLLVRDARSDGRPVAFSAADGAPPRVLISRPGRSTLTLDVVIPIASGSGAEGMALQSSGSALSSVTLAVPRAGVELVVTGGFIAEETETGAG